MADHSLTDRQPLPAHVLPVLRSVMGGATNITTVLRETDRNRSTTHRKLRQLKRLGLVTWDEGKQATLRPLVREVPFGADR